MWQTALTVGWRNLRRRRGRSILTGSMFLFGTMFVVVSIGVADGTYGDMIRLGTRTYMGDFQVLAEDYHDRPSLFKTINNPGAAEQQLITQIKDLEAVTARIESAALFSHEKATFGGGLVGLDLHHEFQVTSLQNQLTDGMWWKAGLTWDDIELAPVVLGKDLAKRLGVALGGKIAIITSAADGSTAADWFQVTGLLNTGNADLDGGLACTPIGIASEFLELGPRVHRLVGRRADGGPRMEAQTLTEDARTLHISPWQVLLPELDSAVKADREGLNLFVLIILIVVLLGCSNTMMMAIFERMREIGVLQAIGTTPGTIIAFTLAEIAWLALLGVSIGALAGAGLNELIGSTGIPLGDESLSYGGIVLDKMTARNSAALLITYPLTIAVAGIVAGLIPAVKATRMTPTDAIRGGTA